MCALQNAMCCHIIPPGVKEMIRLAMDFRDGCAQTLGFSLASIHLPALSRFHMVFFASIPMEGQAFYANGRIGRS